MLSTVIKIKMLSTVDLFLRNRLCSSTIILELSAHNTKRLFKICANSLLIVGVKLIPL